MRRYCDCRCEMVHSLGSCIGCEDKPDDDETYFAAPDLQPVRNACPACNGTGRRSGGACTECKGDGSLLFTPVLKIVWEVSDAANAVREAKIVERTEE